MTTPLSLLLFCIRFYGAINVGSLIGTIAIVYVLESIGWGIGYAICTGAFAGALLVFVLGWSWYKKVRVARGR
jgi:dipeptide/tripeptide permease